MKLATDLRLTFEEYLKYEEDSDTRYELVKGELIPMSLGTGRHGKVTKFIDDQLNQSIDRNQFPWTSQRLTVGIQSPRGNRWDTCRIPDVTVLGLEQWNEMDDREAVIRAHEAAPLLVVEVVSPSTRSEDYSAKWSEYSVLDIGEYWIIDIGKNVVVICILIDGRYQDVEYRDLDIVRSQVFPDLNLTAYKILNSTTT